MASERQIAANRRNALRSTGPRTPGGKSISRRNAYRHGLTAETVIASLEDARDYRTLERMLIEDYGPQTVIQQQLVVRLASLLWRLRRATLIETGLFELNRAPAPSAHQNLVTRSASLQVFYEMLRKPESSLLERSRQTDMIELDGQCRTDSDDAYNAASAYHRLSRLSPKLISRLSRYETALWRQVAQTLAILEYAQVRKLNFRR